ncbi:MAG TPA: hypothetical protein VJM50_14810 [Pyrinomonadaceae bacterium]|nr:hypothetical protein [Pyrinomonadaceae bacterium]
MLMLVIFGATGMSPGQQTDPLTITKDGKVGIGTATPANKLSVTGNADVSGNVGIGAASPDAKLHVNGIIRVDDSPFKVFVAGKQKGFVGPGKNNDLSFVVTEKSQWLRLGANDGAIALWANGNAESAEPPQVFLNAAGNVGIGTNSPTKAKLEISGFVNQNTKKYGFLRNPWSAQQDGNVEVVGKYEKDQVNIPYSIWAERRIAAEEFDAFSDERLKNIQGRSDSAIDLRTLLGIEITDYRHKDVIAKGHGTYKKVTGQQVAKVFPQAVRKHTEVVPDIYQPAAIQDGWVALATDLKKGERVKLITEKGEGIYDVLEVMQDRFRTDFKPEGNRVFVYGREVKDFLTVDYEAISMLNVSATQQIKKEKDEEVKALQDENAALRRQLAEQEKRLAELEAKDKVRDEKLAAIQSLLVSRDQRF